MRRLALIAAIAVTLATPAAATAGNANVWLAPGQTWGPRHPDDLAGGTTLRYQAGRTLHRVCGNGTRAFYGQLTWTQEGVFFGTLYWRSRIRVYACAGTSWLHAGSIVAYWTAWQNRDSSTYSWAGRSRMREWAVRRVWFGAYRVRQTRLTRKTAGVWTTTIGSHGGVQIPQVTVELYRDVDGTWLAHFIDRSEYCTTFVC